MIKKNHNRLGQLVSMEYLVVFFVVLGAVIAMNVYVRRTFQARAYHAQLKVMESAEQALGQRVPLEYEPYYAEVVSNVDQRTVDRTRFNATGAYVKTIDYERVTNTNSQQLPPGRAR